MHMYCDNHPDALAGWVCVECGATACSACAKVIAGGKVTICSTCDGMMSRHERLRLGAPTEFWAALHGVFTMPFGAKSLIQLMTASLLSMMLWVIALIWTLGAGVIYLWFTADGVVPPGFESKPAAMALVLILMGMVTVTVVAVGLYGYLTNYAHFICNEASGGSQTLPLWADYLSYAESCVAPAARGASVFMATMGPAVLTFALMVNVLNSVAAALGVAMIPALVGGLIRPIVFLRMAQFEDFSGLSMAAFSVMTRHVGQYVVVVAVQLGALAPVFGGALCLALSPSIGSFLITLVLMPLAVYFSMIFSQIAGVFYRCNRLDFGGI